VIEYRWAEGRSERFTEIAAEFVRLNVDVIVTQGTPPTLATKTATAAIPIVSVVMGDPVGNNLVASLARPGGNVTGFSIQTPDIAGKRLELLREVVPGLRRVAFMGNVDNPIVPQELREVQIAAGTLGIEVTALEIRHAQDILPSFEALKNRAEALYLASEGLVDANRLRVNILALGARLPTMWSTRELVEAGGLLAYGPSFPDLYRRAGDLVDKILRGVKPGNIPVEQPTKFDLVVNLIVAKAARSRNPTDTARPCRRGDRMKRRDFIRLVGGAAASPVAVHAQSPAMPVIGFLHVASPGAYGHVVAGLRRGLAEADFVEGRNVAVEYRWGEGELDRMPALLGDLLRHQVSVIVGSLQGAQAAKSAGVTIPVVFSTSDDPVKQGFVESLNRPGGNMTGAYLFTAELEGKRLGLLHDLLPKATVMAVLVDASHPVADAQLREVQAAAARLGVQLVVLHANSDHDFETVFATLIKQKAEALLICASPSFNNRRDQLVALTARHNMPAASELREFAAAGGLLSYGNSLVDVYRQLGVYAGRILKGANPADLPVVRPTKFELVINLKTARALGINISDNLLLLADEVIE
jgi:putative tryptophan/tyrosine transport system substrate-binding protein